MTCTEVQRILPELMEGNLNGEAQAHLKTCPVCSELVSDLERISAQARQLAAAEEPPVRVWVRIAAELRSEGLIHEPDPVPLRPLLVPSRRRWSAWWLVPVTAAVVVAGSYFVTRKPAPPVAEKPAVVVPASSNAVNPPAQVAKENPAPPTVERKLPKTANPVPEEPAFSAPVTMVGTNSSEEQDQQFLDELTPAMRSSYEGQLRAVNAYIRDAEAYVRQNPGDEDARRHLMDAYEQKAMLYQMALDHIQ